MLKHIEIACDFRIYYGRMWSIGDSNSRLLAWSGRGSGAPLEPHSLPNPFESRHRGFEFAPAGLVGIRLWGSTGAPFTTESVRIPLFRIIKTDTQMGVRFDWWSIGDSNSRLRAWSGFGSGAPLEPHSLPNPFESRHRGFEFALRLGRGAALRPHCGLIHHRARSNPQLR